MRDGSRLRKLSISGPLHFDFCFQPLNNVPTLCLAVAGCHASVDKLKELASVCKQLEAPGGRASPAPNLCMARAIAIHGLGRRGGSEAEQEQEPTRCSQHWRHDDRELPNASSAEFADLREAGA